MRLLWEPLVRVYQRGNKVLVSIKESSKKLFKAVSQSESLIRRAVTALKIHFAKLFCDISGFIALLWTKGMRFKAKQIIGELAHNILTGN